MAAKFGTSGLRGLATELIGDTTRRYVTAFAHHMVQGGALSSGKSVCIGWDYRDSSPGIVADAELALGALGIPVIRCGAVPTPALAAYAMLRDLPSIMVTGSHIPADRNGIKFYRPDGEIGKQDEAAISAEAGQLGSEFHTTPLPPTPYMDASDVVVREFVSRCGMLAGPGSLSGLRIGVYQHSTVARDVMVDVLRQAGADVVALDRSEIFIPVDTEAVSPQTELLLRNHAMTGRFAAIVSADGDGDRPLVSDESGNVIRGDVLGLLTARFLAAETVVTPITSNSGIDQALGLNVFRTRVGSPYVIAAMQQAEARGGKRVVGFEANGGFLLHTNFALPAGELTALPTRDSFLPILAVLLTAKQRQQPLSAIVGAEKLPFAHGGRLEKFAAEVSMRLLAELQSSSSIMAGFFAEKGEVLASSDLDGLRVTLTGTKTVHLRPSGNAPEFRCYVEAPSEQEAHSLLAWAFEKVQAYANQ